MHLCVWRGAVGGLLKVTHWSFDVVAMLCTLLNTGVLAYYHHNMTKDTYKVLEGINDALLIWFWVETLLKVITSVQPPPWALVGPSPVGPCGALRGPLGSPGALRGYQPLLKGGGYPPL